MRESDLKVMDGFLFHHVGALNKDRNPYTLLKVLGDLCKENLDLKKELILKFTGKSDFWKLFSIRVMFKDNLLFLNLKNHK